MQGSRNRAVWLTVDEGGDYTAPAPSCVRTHLTACAVRRRRGFRHLDTCAVHIVEGFVIWTPARSDAVESFGGGYCTA